MKYDYFRVQIQDIGTENNRIRLNELLYTTYPDVVLDINRTLGPGRSREGTPIDFELDASHKGIFALKKVVERFDPWVIVEGMVRLDKSDFPDRLFKVVDEGGVGKHWSSAESRISELRSEVEGALSDRDYFHVRIRQIDSSNWDPDYMSRIHRNFKESFIRTDEKLGPESSQGGPKAFDLSNDSSGWYVLKKVIERFDPWVTISAARRIDKSDMPERLFGTVDEGGVGRNWSEQAAARVEALDWP